MLLSLCLFAAAATHGPGFRHQKSCSFSLISSLSNERVKLMKSLGTTKGRKEHKLIRLEGHRQVLEASRLGFQPSLVLFTRNSLPSQLQVGGDGGVRNYQQQLNDMLERWDEKSVSMHEVSDEVMSSISDTVTSQGVIAAFVKPTPINWMDWQQSKASSPLLLLLLDNVSDPGNVGTLIRSASAFGVDAVLAVGGCDIWSDKVIRSSMGAVLTVPIFPLTWNSFRDQFHHINNNNNNNNQQPFQILYAEANPITPSSSLSSSQDSHGVCSYRDVDYCRQTLVMIGSEATGFSNEAKSFLSQQQQQQQQERCVSIAMTSSVESLNAAVAGSIILSEAFSQRQHNKQQQQRQI